MEEFNNNKFLRDPNRYYIFYILSLYLVVAYYLLQWPITAGDTDLWYHLNSGRYILEHRALPHDSFFSFISPPREWVNYYWLFQVLVYKIYLFSGYYGLIFLRAVVYIATVSVVLNIFLKKDGLHKPAACIIIFFILYFLFLLPRYQLIRPHMFSYLFIAAFIYIMEFRPKRLLCLLSLIAVLWINLHGIEYPVMLLITLSYLIEFFSDYMRKKTDIKKEDILFLVNATVSLAAVFISPNGSKLIGIPLTSTESASQYISELLPVKPGDLLSFQVLTGSPAFTTIFNLLFIISCIALIVSARSRNLRLSHFLMFAGGAVLLTKGNRFMYEFILLALPVLIIYLRSISSLSGSITKAVPPVIVIIAMIFLPYQYLKNIFENQPRYPVSPKNLPHGVAAFLNRIPAGGAVLNHPDSGGYLQWMLYPRYRIFMDMEIPFLFTNVDNYTAVNSFLSEEVLRDVVSRYNPAFITAPVKTGSFKEVIKKFPDYIMVFFDDSEVLYVNRKLYPDIAQNYEIKAIDPFTLTGKKIDSLTGEGEAFLKSLLGLISICPDCGITNQLVAMIYIGRGEYNKSVTHAAAVVKNFPESTAGYKLMGDSFKGLKSYDKAISYYEMALKKSGGADTMAIYRNTGLIYLEQHQYKKAYNALKNSINILSPDTTYMDLYYFGSAALLAGKTGEAASAFMYAYQKIPPADTEWRERIKKNLALLGIKTGSY